MRVMVLLAALAVGLVWLVTGGTRTHAWNQKMTITVETPSGPVTSSSVVRVTFQRGIWWLRSLDMDKTQLHGESFALEVSPGKWLFALLPQQENMLYHSIKQRSEVRDDRSKIKAYTQPIVVASRHYPNMVTFTDLLDPDSLLQVNPRQLSYRFGPGIEISSITVQATKEKVTSGRVPNLLPWVCAMRGENRTLGRTENRFANVNIQAQNFVSPKACE